MRPHDEPKFYPRLLDKSLASFFHEGCAGMKSLVQTVLFYCQRFFIDEETEVQLG